MLPAELFDLIFSFLRGDIPALEACSQAHPYYSRLAERYLYANLLLQTEQEIAISELQLSKNPYILDYVRTLSIGHPDLTHFSQTKALSILSMIPRMPNLVSLHLCGLEVCTQFVSTFRNCLLHSSIDELYLRGFHHFPLSVLDNGKNIRKLALINCRAITEPISSSGSLQPSLKTLIIKHVHNDDLILFMAHRVTHLASLDLPIRRASSLRLLTACSDSLTSLHLEVGEYCRSVYTHQTDRGYWSNTEQKFALTLSVFKCLKILYISSSGSSMENRTAYSLFAIIRLIKTATSIQTVVLRFRFWTQYVTPIGQLDWSPLTQLFGICPYIELRISVYSTFRCFSPEDILDALAGNKALMELVKRDMIVLKAEYTDSNEDPPFDTGTPDHNSVYC